MIIQITSLANYDKLVEKFRQSNMWTDMWCEDKVERIRGYIEKHLGKKSIYLETWYECGSLQIEVTDILTDEDCLNEPSFKP